MTIGRTVSATVDVEIIDVPAKTETHILLVNGIVTSAGTFEEGNLSYVELTFTDVEN